MIIEIFSSIDAETQRSIISATRDIDPSEPIEIDITSYGGDVFAGMAIADWVSQLPNPTTARVYGIAASAAADIALACKRVVMTDLGALMIHSAWTTGADADDPGIRQANAIQNRIIGRRLKDFTVEGLDGKEWWIDAREAEKLGLADELIPSTAPAALAASCRGVRGVKILEDKMPEAVKAEVDASVVDDKKKEGKVEAVCKDETKAAAEVKTEDRIDIMDIIGKILDRLDAIEGMLAEKAEAVVKTEEDIKKEDVVEARIRDLYARAATICTPAPRPEDTVKKAESPAKDETAADRMARLKAENDAFKKMFPNLHAFSI